LVRVGGRVTATRFQRLNATIMTPDAALEFPIEQLIGALNKKLFMECARVRSTMRPISRALVAMLTAEVRSREQEGNLRY